MTIISKTIRILFASLSVFLVLCFGLEALARAEFVQASLLPPSMGSNDLNFDSRLLDLENASEVDCVFIGSSLTMRSINPAVVEAAYREVTGELIECFNLNNPGITIIGAAYLVEFVIETYQPKVVFVEIAHRDFLGNLGSKFDQTVLNTPWLQYKGGEFSAEGWLFDHSASFRLYDRYRDWASADFVGRFDVELEDEQYFTDDGYAPALVPLVNVDAPPSTDAKLDRDYLNLHQRGVNVKRPMLDALDHILALDTSTQIIGLEMPLHPSYMQFYPNGRSDWEAFIDRVRPAFRKSDTPLWITNDKLEIPTEFWRDRSHVLATGSLVFSDWVGHQLALAEEQDFSRRDVPEPNLPLRAIGELYADNPLGLPTELANNYQNATPIFAAEEIAVPAFTLHPEHLAYNLATYLRVTEADYSPADLELLWLLNHLPSADILPTEQQNALAEWQQSGNTAPLQANDIDYVVVNGYQRAGLPLGNLTLRSTFQHPVLRVQYFIYQIPQESP